MYLHFKSLGWNGYKCEHKLSSAQLETMLIPRAGCEVDLSAEGQPRDYAAFKSDPRVNKLEQLIYSIDFVSFSSYNYCL